MTERAVLAGAATSRTRPTAIMERTLKPLRSSSIQPRSVPRTLGSVSSQPELRSRHSAGATSTS